MMTERRSGSARRLVALFLVGPLLAACGESTTEPGLEVSQVVGSYTMTVLHFDPQGSLPGSDILSILMEPPQLTLTSAGQAQVVYRDPISTLVVTIQGTFQTTPTGLRIDFASESPYRQLLFSRQMGFAFSAVSLTLTFATTAPDGVSRARLIELVPALEGEQLLDPTPGVLSVSFTRS